MKHFFASLLGTLAAFLLLALGAVVVTVGVLGVVAMMGNRTVIVEDRSYLVFDLSVNVTDAPPQFDSSAITQALTGGGEPMTLQLRAVTDAIGRAAKDSRIAGILLVGEMTPSGYGSGFAALKELRQALVDFRASGKPVMAYLENATTLEYYLASAADEIVLDPYGMIAMPGLASEPMFYAGAFEKFGVGVQVTRVGKYKSAVEPFIRQDLSPENREQYTQLLGDIWSDLIADIAEGRGLTPEDIQALVDKEGLIRPDVAVASKWVSRTAYRDEVLAELKERTGVDDGDDYFTQISLETYARLPVPGLATASRHGRVAVVYAEGEIVDGEGNIGEVGGTRFARELRRLRQDDDIDAIVVRVNSPGGSATASEHIQREIRLAKEDKPVVISMGSYAASGGYWISAYGDRIFAEPSTITGSIGVFGLQFDVKKLANETLGLTFDSVKTGQYADLFTITRPKTEGELAVIQSMVDWIYEEFITKVAEARKIDRTVVQEIAQGRVWSGTQALDLGLVDEIGGLDAALAHAASTAGLGDNYRIVEFPREKPLAEALVEMIEGIRPATRSSVASRWLARLQEPLVGLDKFNDPRGVYARLPIDLRIR
ncbi:MAG TPA: signal peptide peptidase SppA [Opitutaceae bacterium]